MKHIEEFLHLIAAISLPFILLIAFFFEFPKEIIELTVIVVIVLFSIVLAILFGRRYKTSNEEVNLFWTLLTGELKPTQLGKLLSFNIDVLIIEDSEKTKSFSEEIKRIFKEEVSEGNLKIVAFKPDKINFPEQQKKLETKLKNTKAVLVVKNENFDNPEMQWLYLVIDKWANENSELPCLFVSNQNNKLKKDGISNKYLYIPRDGKYVPWRLMQRANDRSFLWNYQSDFNRLMLKHTLILIFALVTLIVFMGLSDYKDKKKNETSITQLQEKRRIELRQIYEKRQIELRNKIKKYYLDNEDKVLIQIVADQISTRFKEQFENSVFNSFDDKIFVSYWVKDKIGKSVKFRNVGSSNPTSNHVVLEDETELLVGCSFKNPKAFVEYVKFEDVDIVNLYTEERKALQNTSCRFKPEPGKDIKSMVCFTLGDYLTSDIAVAICIRSEGETIIQKYDYSPFLALEVREFYKLREDLAKP